MFRTAPAALLALALACGPARPALCQDAPAGGNGEQPPPTAAPLPPDPKDKVAKALEKSLADWFYYEPFLPPPKHDALKAKAARAVATGEMEKSLLLWAADTKGNDPLRKLAWWRVRMHANHPKESVKTGVQKQEILIAGLKYQVVTSVPKAYRANGEEHYPLVLAAVDKEGDARKVVEGAYRDLAATHVIVAVVEDRALRSQDLLHAMYWAELTYRIDREAVVLDGLGKAARLVEDMAPDWAVQFQGAVYRAPTKVHPVAVNLGLFPCYVLQREPATDAVKEAVEAIAKASPSAVVAKLSTEPDDAVQKGIQDWIKALPKRAVSDPTRAYTWATQNLRDMRQWGYWILVKEPVDVGPIEVTVDRDAKSNEVRLVAKNLSIGILLLNDEVLDLDRPVVVRVNGIEVAKVQAVRGLGATFNAMEGLLQTHSPPRDYFITALVPFQVNGDARIPEADRKAAEEAAKKAAEEEEKRKAEEAAAAAGGPPPAEGAPPAEPPKEGEAPKPAETPKEGEAPAPPPDPAPAPPPAGEAPPPKPVAWSLDPDLAAAFAAAAAEKKPLLVVVNAGADDAGQKRLEALLARADVSEAAQPVRCVRFNGADAPAKEALALVSPEAAAPAVVLFDAERKVLASLLAADLTGDEAAAAKKLLDALQPFKPKKEIGWVPEGWKAAVALAASGKRPILAVVDGAPDATGQKGVQPLLDRPEVLDAAQGAVCVRLAGGGEAPSADASEVLALIAADAKAPAVAVFGPDAKPVPRALLAADLAGDGKAAAGRLLDALLAARPKQEIAWIEGGWKAASGAAAKEGKPILAVVDGAPGSAAQLGLDALVLRPAVAKAGQAASCVRLAGAGEKASPEAKELLGSLGKDAVAPAVVVFAPDGKAVKPTLLPGDLEGEGAAAEKRLLEALEAARPRPPEAEKGEGAAK